MSVTSGAEAVVGHVRVVGCEDHEEGQLVVLGLRVLIPQDLRVVIDLGLGGRLAKLGHELGPGGLAGVMSPSWLWLTSLPLELVVELAEDLHRPLAVEVLGQALPFLLQPHYQLHKVQFP